MSVLPISFFKIVSSPKSANEEYIKSVDPLFCPSFIVTVESASMISTCAMIFPSNSVISVMSWTLVYVTLQAGRKIV